ncbi:protein PIN-LIKES 7 isoform X1 [Phoenix dactylifera]|uniref:Protein PIN-LIKES 7 isoform X1 n=2 Tax=Phoenix dactylifera TaxID=42345 RepID=A0A8B8J3Q4_PHODC|nr:protein PIN-LIKES 7 isoform X1 [Phoenix dactylifera]XP_026659605.2 protein PIN-LIKES 7 isoform X1 [Phoenix dactylifera]XP_026659606.2 protein PIN-LIKES 7 isoform X1 [Phoenix dactylifera]XP_026659607.2 protein PIN-LIKES 7 isoform X1 [Phoenix dactylifera]XP_026659608.2 protein PIN-LIKES 7 isoform X1 [Phoenix dactylifera]XP_038972430.1 protein PIN-LIKES 7 isoform X1 [Phoenix dactylifera]XP_038972431.1 protein PIN-LIKES 7 isoform X1 [Phoenix dactylifera]
MGFWSLLMVASMPNLQVLLVGLLGAFLASGYINILSTNALRDVNKIVFAVFSPALVFASLSETITLQDILSWWFMPINIGIIFSIGGILGWVVVKILKPEHHLEGLVIASCSAGNLGTLLLIIIPAICNEDRNPFGESSDCKTLGLSYASFSMALGNFFIWSHTYSLMRKSSVLHEKIHSENGIQFPENDSMTSVEAQNQYKEGRRDQEALLLPPTKPTDGAAQHQSIVPLLSKGEGSENKVNFWMSLKATLHQISNELLAPPTIAAIFGLVIGMIPWLKSLIIGATAPLRVIQDSISLLGDGSIPCATLILGGNLTPGIRGSAVKPVEIVAIICVRYVILPLFGIAVVEAAGELGFLPPSPLFQYMLLIQFTLPPAMSIGTMAQLFDAGKEECSVIFLWTYLVAAIALTVWSTIFMWILS